ncbi:ERCC4 domain-containing protein [Chloracidobacterium thermophilum]|uniref:ERCC4 domain-containing protein n=1 Tax=Chloracidobacterium thermophilum TaxID=458033 RepID=UPI00073854DA|nr:ERCC4 domain-containing protein [Chloracidobacterium thermophilum]HML93827.1 ERCC4 domain-containing protein [Thermodesulfobacteriota bacterium]
MDRVTVVVDTREQEPYTFESGCTEVVRRALPAGDYSVEGHEDSVAVERKTLEDFVSTVIRSRKRFTRELRRLCEYDAACVVVEADLRDILGGRYRSGAHPNAVLGALLSIVVDFGIPVFFCSDRQAACRFVEEFLHRYHRKVSRRCEQDQTTNP